MAVAALVGVLIGRMIRGRDRQVPKDAPAVAGGGPRIPTQGSGVRPAGPPAPREPGAPPSS